MNAAARILQQRASQSSFAALAAFSNPRPVVISLLVLLIFISSLAIVYITHASRNLHAGLHQATQYYNHLYSEREQLLLDKSSLFMQTRIQKIAEHSLDMVVPGNPWVIVVKN